MRIKNTPNHHLLCSVSSPSATRQGAHGSNHSVRPAPPSCGTVGEPGYLSPAPLPCPASAGQSERADLRAHPVKRSLPNPFAPFRQQSPDNSRLLLKSEPSLFGSFRKPGREAAEHVRVSPGPAGRAKEARPSCGPSRACGCSREFSARRKAVGPPRCPLGAPEQHRSGAARRGHARGSRAAG